MGVRIYKVGGPALQDPDLLAPLAEEVRRGGPALLVHGGGRRVDEKLRALSLESRYVGGRRETSPAIMEVVEMVLSGELNKSLASRLTRAGLPSVGVSGRDGGLMRARLEPALGRVGLPDEVNPAVLHGLWAAGFLPVVSPVSDGPDGHAVNVNADEAALGLARALGAESLVYLSDVDGVKVGGRLLDSLTEKTAQELIATGEISGGMALKVKVALEAAQAVPDVVIAGKARLLGGFRGTRIEGARS